MRVKTRQLIKASLREAGWVRMHTRPANGQTVVIGQEWIDRRYGITDQFLTSHGQYYADTDSVECGDNGFIRAVYPASMFHWWMPIFTPDQVDIVCLHARSVFLRTAAQASGYGGIADSL